MRVGVPKETARGERRVALVPEAVRRLTDVDAVVERGAGDAAGFADQDYAEAVAAIGDLWTAEIVVKVVKPSAAEVERLGEGRVLLAFLQPLTDATGIERLAERGVVAFAME